MPGAYLSDKVLTRNLREGHRPGTRPLDDHRAGMSRIVYTSAANTIALRYLAGPILSKPFGITFRHRVPSAIK